MTRRQGLTQPAEKNEAMRKGRFALGALVLVCALPATGPARAADLPPRGTATQVLYASTSSYKLPVQALLSCWRIYGTGTYKTTTLGVGLRDAEGTWIAATVAMSQSALTESTSVATVTVGERHARGFPYPAGLWGVTIKAWNPALTATLKAPFRIFFAVGTFGKKLDRCQAWMNGSLRPVSSNATGGYVDLGSPANGVATFNRGQDESLRVEGWVNPVPHTVTLSGGRVFGSIQSAPPAAVVAWRRVPGTAVDAPNEVLNGLAFGSDQATRIDVSSSGAWLAGRGGPTPSLVWFDLK